mmetsp:Transcript_74099/g.131025  ORF Transcript_74099/g.131025 Transcript_74099/m.131025 type:complete len:271 (-) Transcript_74099:219-1031(-)
MPQPKANPESVYDLREEDQLALAMQQSLREQQSEDPDAAGGGFAAPAPAPAPAASERQVWLTPDRGAGVPLAPEEVGRMRQMADTGGSSSASSGGRHADGAGAPLPVAPTDPEWSGGHRAEDAAGGPPAYVHFQPPQPAPPPAPMERPVHSMAGAGAPDAAGGGCREVAPELSPPSAPASLPSVPASSSTSAVFFPPPPRAPRPVVAGGGVLEEAVQRSLELATARQFDEAEQVLARLASEYPELASTREVTAAWEAVAMCKQFHLQPNS